MLCIAKNCFVLYCMTKFSQRMGNGFHIVAGDC